MSIDTKQKLVLDVNKLKQRIGFFPHAKQQDVLANLRRFNVICGGKRVGKSILVAYLALRELLTSNKNIWVLAPTYDLAKRSFDYLVLWTRYFPDILKVTNAPEPKITSIYGSTLWLKSAENPKSLLGQPLDLLIMDEASRIEEEIWSRYLRPNLMDRKGKAVLISNPFGKNYFYDLYNQEKYDEEWKSFFMPTAIEDASGNIIGTSNPDNISIEELTNIKKTTTSEIYAQEYLATFMEGSGQVFRNVKACVSANPAANHKQNHLVYIGADLARLVDFTVLTALCRNYSAVLEIDRFNQVSWNIQKERIINMSKKYGDAVVVVDSTGVGDPIVEDLKNQGLLVEDFKYNASSKKKLIDKLSIMIEKGRLKYPNNPVLISELEAFSFERTKGGTVKYFSPGSKHDDTVNSLALSCWLLEDYEEVDYPTTAWTPRHGKFN